MKNLKHLGQRIKFAWQMLTYKSGDFPLPAAPLIIKIGSGQHFETLQGAVNFTMLIHPEAAVNLQLEIHQTPTDVVKLSVRATDRVLHIKGATSSKEKKS